MGKLSAIVLSCCFFVSEKVSKSENNLLLKQAKRKRRDVASRDWSDMQKKLRSASEEAKACW